MYPVHYNPAGVRVFPIPPCKRQTFPCIPGMHTLIMTVKGTMTSGIPARVLKACAMIWNYPVLIGLHTHF